MHSAEDRRLNRKTHVVERRVQLNNSGVAIHCTTQGFPNPDSKLADVAWVKLWE